MNTSLPKIQVLNLDVEIIKKDIKNIHLGVYPPDGRIRMAVPLGTNDESIRLFIISKIPWIKKQQGHFSTFERQTSRKYVSGETHYIFGEKYRLHVIYSNEPQRAIMGKRKYIDLYVKPKSTIKQRENILKKYYKSEMDKIIPKLIDKWEKKVGVKVKEVKIKKMKTKWGTCNDQDKRIWLNLELAKKPFHCIDYVFVHELIHLKEKKHSERFLELLGAAYPKWKQHKKELNEGMLSESEWGCESNSKLKQIISI